MSPVQFVQLILAIPELIKLARQLQKHRKEKKVKDDVKKINETFKTTDVKAMEEIFKLDA